MQCLRCGLRVDHSAKLLGKVSCLSRFDGWHLFKDADGHHREFRDSRYQGVEARPFSQIHDEPATVVGQYSTTIALPKCGHPILPRNADTGLRIPLVDVEKPPVQIDAKRDTNFETATQAWLFLSTLNLHDQPIAVQRKQVEITARLGHTLRKSPLWKAWSELHDKTPKVEERPMLAEEDLL